MYCWNCGKEMEDDLLFCPHCAMKQAGIPEPKQTKKIPLIPILCGAACLLTVLLAVGVFLLGNHALPEEPVDPYSVALPDPASFLNTRYTRDDRSEYTHHVTCTVKDTYGPDALEEYVQLLQKKKYQLTLEDSWDYTSGGVPCRDIIFRYGGKNDAIGWVHHKDGYKYHVKLSFRYREKKGEIEMILYTAHGFELTDPGVDAKALN